MPRVRYEGSRALRILLAKPIDHVYKPGDIIIGKVIRQQHIVASRGQVTIFLLGRVKTKIDKTYDNGTYTTGETYRSQLCLFYDQETETTRVLYSGPLHIAADEADPLVLPFGLKIPKCNSSLPANFSATSSLDECYVEYWLDAEIFPSPGTESRTANPALARHPIVLGNLTDEVAREEVYVGTAQRHSICAYRLIPNMEEAQLTFKQMIKQFLHMPSVPSLSFLVRMDLPADMQLEDPNTIPLLLRISRVDRRTSEAVRKTTHMATINNIRIMLKTHVRFSAGEDDFSYPRESSAREFVYLGLGTALAMLPTPLAVNIDPSEQAIDLGILLNLHLTKYGLASGNQLLVSPWKGLPITPCFETSILRVWHSLRVTISFTVGGKKRTNAFTSPCRILGQRDIPRPVHPSR